MKFSVNFKLSNLDLKYWVGISVNLLVALVEVLLAARVVASFIFTSASGSFFHWLSTTTDGALAPFRGLFGTATPVKGTNWYVDWVALFAMAAYPVVFYAAISFIGWLGRRR